MATAIPISLALRNLKVSVASGEALDVREFHVREGMSRLFDIDLHVVSPNADVDFEAIIGGPARFEIGRPSSVDGGTRAFAGVCSRIEQVGVDPDGLASYELRIAPRMWLATQRRTYRVFQDQSELDVALAVLADWGITPRLALSPGAYEKRRYRVQYAESDFDFVSRMLEDIGVAYHFEDEDGDTRLVLVDAPNRAAPRPSITFVAAPNDRIRHEWVTDVRSLRRVRPGKYTQSDVDWRKPLDYPLSASATAGDVEASLERYHHNYGSFLWKGGGGGTPVADDRGPARSNEGLGRSQVARRLEAQRVERRGCTWRTNAHDMRPGVVFSLVAHPRAELGAAQLVVGSDLRGSATGEWVHTCETRYVDTDYRPELATPKPRTLGIESATVTGPAGEEIHTDEFGRVRVHFHWDRQGPNDEQSSCWVPVSQPWAGAGFGAISLPRVGQEVLVDFLGEDPDRPVVVGRVFTATMPPPYELPKYKMVSGLRSESYPRPKKAAGGGRMGGGPIVVGAAVVAARPLGGGPRHTSLGGGAGAGADAMAGGLKQIMPGAFGGDQAPQAALEDAVTKMRSPGPDGADASRSANGLVSDDAANDEKLYLQAQRDLRIVVKNNFVGAVGANRAFSVLRNDYEGIKGYQAVKVGKDRTIEVTGKMKHTVQKDMLDHGLASRKHTTKVDYGSKSEQGHSYKSKTGHGLKVQGSCFLVFPHTILIDAPKVYINPGKKAVDAAMNGQNVADLMANEQREDRVQRAMEAIAKHDMASRFSPKVKQDSLAATGRGANTPFSEAARQAGVTDRSEISEAARRMHDIMYVPS